MYTVGRIGSYISKGVYTVSGPFHPFGGAVDIIVVEQQDGSFKSSPWYVRFGKFQGVLKTREKLVNISVNGVEANFHMYLDHKGETYFLREADVEGGETGLYSFSSGDEMDGKSQNKNRPPQKSKSCNFDVDMSNSVNQVDMSNEKILSRTNSKQSRIHGLVFGQRSKKQQAYQEGEDGAGMARARARARAESLERAEIAADLLEVKWSTNLAFNKPRKDNAAENVQINDEKGQASSSVDYNVENSLDQCVLNEEIGSLNEQMGDSSLSSSENLESFFEETRIEVSCIGIPQEFTETVVAGESVLEEECKVISTLSSKIDVGDAKHNENAKDVISEVTCADSEVQFLIEVEAHPEKHTGEEEIFHVRDVLPGRGISQEESGTDTVQSFIYSETSESLIVAMDGSGEETHETMYLASGGDGEVHVHAEMLHSTTELLPEETVTLQAPEDGGLQTKLGEVPENPSQQINPSPSCIDKGNVVDLEEPLTGPEFYTQMVTMDPTLEVDSQNICTSSFSNSGHQVQDKKKKKDEEITSKLQPSLETLGECVPTEAVSSLPSLSFYEPGFAAPANPFTSTTNGRGSTEEEQFLFSDPEEFKIGEVQYMESISPEQVDRESPSISLEGKEVNGSVNERYGSYSSPKKFVQQIPLTDLDNSMEKSRITSSPILIPRSHKVSGEEVGQLVKSLPNLWSHTENPDAHDFYPPFSPLPNSSFKSLNPMLRRKDDSSYIESDEDLKLAQEQRNVEDTQISEPKGVLANPAVGDPSKSSVATGGSWGLWPFSFRRSRSTNGIQPALNDARISEPENTSESTICINENKNELKPKVVKRMVREIIPTSEQLASLNLKEGRNIVTFTFSTAMLGKQQVDARIYLWKWNTRIVISDVDGTITKSDVLGQFMPLVGMDWSQTGVAHLFSAIKENGYQLLFLSARAISQAYHTRQFLFNLKQDGKALPDGPVVISPDGLFPSLYREVIRRAPHEFKISCLEAIRALFPSDCNPFYAGFGNRDTDEFSYLKVGIPKGKIFIINPKGEVAVNRRVDTKSYSSLHSLVHGMFPSMTSSDEQEDFNSWNFWKLPPTV